MPAAEGPPLQAVYLGGGTPTALVARDLSRLIAAIRRHLPLTPDCEITLEGRIHSFGLTRPAPRWTRAPPASRWGCRASPTPSAARLAARPAGPR